MNNNNSCKPESNRYRPVIDLNKCESDGRCVKVCPKEVLIMKEMTSEENSRLTLKGKLKTLVHGKLKASVLNPDACQACGDCMRVCPENAIKLEQKITGSFFEWAKNKGNIRIKTQEGDERRLYDMITQQLGDYPINSPF